MKRLWAPFLLACALLLAQLGAAGHALSHYGPGEDKERPHGVCQLCVAYAGLDQGASAAATPLPCLPTWIAPATSLAAGHACTAPVAYRSRAPPLLAA
jgi:hypothetical protein